MSLSDIWIPNNRISIGHQINPYPLGSVQQNNGWTTLRVFLKDCQRIVFDTWLGHLSVKQKTRDLQEGAVSGETGTLPMGRTRKKGSQHRMKQPTTMPRVLAAFSSRVNFSSLGTERVQRLCLLISSSSSCFSACTAFPLWILSTTPSVSTPSPWLPFLMVFVSLFTTVYTRQYMARMMARGM